ncbi:GGDEF and PAS domains-containing protein [Desulfonema limicola]|uniref:diguanylate cyclase n=1 Tax=Desulfonema limicola TaxID=45656 RepID=A0A975GJW2_9BACT|nr:diguanylate cyclase [Desulfonema limicola]QTA83967.1 GGDEF and PAS domains-containing protein [Desulfonema limicola]
MFNFIAKSFVAKAGMAASALALSVALSAGLISYIFTAKQLTQMQQNEMDNRARIISSHLGNELRNIVENLSDTSNNTLFANALADSEGRDNYLMPFLNTFIRVGAVKVKVILNDFQGSPLASNPIKMPVTPELELLKKTVDLEKSFLQLNSIEKDIYITVFSPVLYANTGLPEGSLVYQFKFNEITDDIFNDNKGSFCIFFAKTDKKEKYLLKHGDYNHESAVFRTSSVEAPQIFNEWELTVEVCEDEKKLTDKLVLMASQYVLLCIVSLLIIVLVSLIGSRWMLARLKTLEAIAVKVVESKSLDQRFPQQGYDEIAKIGKAFNHMLESLNQAYHELKSEANREMKLQSERFQRILSASLEGYVSIDMDNLVIEEVNKAFCDMTGYDCVIWEGQPVPDFFLPIVKRAGLTVNSSSWTEEFRIQIQEKEAIDLLFHCNLDIDQDNNRQLVVFITDISERKAAEAKLKSVNDQLLQSIKDLKQRDRELTLLNRMNDLLLASRHTEEAFDVVRLTASKLFPDAAGFLAILNHEKQLLEVVVSWGKKDCISQQFYIEECWAMRQGRLHQVTGNEDDVFCSHLKRNSIQGSICLPLVVKGKTMGLLWLEIVSKDESSIERINKLSISLGDAIKLALSNLELREALHEQATRDPLTKLYNRRFFSDIIIREITRVKKTNTPLSIAIIDLDHFKSVNDLYGHDAGDQVLIELANLLHKRIIKPDIAFRFGGEEFVVLFPETDFQSAVKCLEDIKDTLENMQITHHGTKLRTITMSGGVAQYPLHGHNEEALLKAADNALYKAKEMGRNNVQTA